MQPIGLEQAARVLASDPHKYKYFIERLSAPNHPVMETRAALATEGDPPSIIFSERLFCRDWANGSHLDVQLFLARSEDIDDLIEALPKEGSAYIFMYDADVVSLMTSRLPMQLDAIRHYFVAPSDVISRTTGEVIELSVEHDSMVMASESERVRKDWGFCVEFKEDGFDAFGIVQDGKLLCFCAVSPNSAGATLAPIREVCLIYTEEAYRRQGLGKALLSGVTRHMMDQGASFYYSVSSDNIASLSTARSLGFIECGLQYAYYTTT